MEIFFGLHFHFCPVKYISHLCKFYEHFKEEKGEVTGRGKYVAQNFETVLDSSSKTAEKLCFCNTKFLFFYSRLGSQIHPEHVFVLLACV